MPTKRGRRRPESGLVDRLRKRLKAVLVGPFKGDLNAFAAAAGVTRETAASWIAAGKITASDAAWLRYRVRKMPRKPTEEWLNEHRVPQDDAFWERWRKAAEARQPHTPDIAALVRIAKAANISLDVLLLEEDEGLFAWVSKTGWDDAYEDALSKRLRAYLINRVATAEDQPTTILEPLVPNNLVGAAITKLTADVRKLLTRGTL